MMKEDFDLVGTLSDDCKVASARHRLDVHFEQAGDERVVGPESALTLFRVLQEAITNVSATVQGDSRDVTRRSSPGKPRCASTPRTRVHLASRSGWAGPRRPLRMANMQTGQEGIGRSSDDVAPGQGTCVELWVHAGEELER